MSSQFFMKVYRDWIDNAAGENKQDEYIYNI